VSYISNIAESDFLEVEDGVDVAVKTINKNVKGLGAFISAGLYEKLLLEIEYIAAMDSFEAGELVFDGGNRMEPSAYNIELVYISFH
jgi:hypothetical protein